MPGTEVKGAFERLVCSRFRNLEDFDWEVGPGSQLLLGANGAGKTSLLEAIYVLATTRSFRTAQLEDCVRHGSENGLRLEGRVDDVRRVDLAVDWDAGAGLERRINGKSADLAEHLSVLPVVSWSVADAAVLGGAPDARRRFLDQGVIGLKPARVTDLSRYRQALRQKRQLLLRGDKGLSSWNGVLAAAAARLVSLRADYCQSVAVAFSAELAASGLDLPAVEISYRPSPAEALSGEEAILGRFEEVAPRERERCAVMLGPHRDEVEITLAGHPVRRTASAGEKKALGLLLVAARASLLEDAGRQPLVLVDDADAELDPARLEAVWSRLATGRQVLATSSRSGVWERLSTTARWRVSGGRIEPLGELSETA